MLTFGTVCSVMQKPKFQETTSGISLHQKCSFKFPNACIFKVNFKRQSTTMLVHVSIFKCITLVLVLEAT